ncbi:protein ELYS isoform X3 [Psammomys obesus]|uniref:protein ELYS isoform X3 n=1 Tax=Psammomys obesus TaxID=48139 RepID=UPI002452DBE8|nr:protein ELYS isoform X3 [Psammomys obesus]XP_055464930.1 protein ELYS isoform X3 [Psammomys obesus]
MQDLTAQVTSDLLQFPEVTVEALGEDEITLESVLRGKFAAGKNGLACLACGPQLEVVNSLTGERLSAYRFSGVNEQRPVVLAVKEFSWHKRTGLLIGLEEADGSILCLYDLGISRVVKAVVLPGRVTAIEPIINHGGASASTQHLHPSLRWLFGVAAVVTDVGQILLIDLCLDDLSCSQNEVEASDLEVITGIPAEVPHIRESVMREGRHLCFQLVSPSGIAISTLSYISRTNQLAVGFSDGYLALWNMKSMKREYYTQLEGGRVPVYAVVFQEPENDPRNCCYLWAVQSTQDSEGDVLSLHLLQLAFGDRKCLASGQILYEGLEYCEERYTLDLAGGMFPLRGQTSNTKLLGCQSIERFPSHGDREESMREALSPDTSVSVFTWQVNIYGQGKPSVYLGLFDINRWYHAQMPDSLRSGESLHNCSYFALWSLDSVVSRTSPHHILDILVHERSLSRGVPPSYPPPEQFFNPSTFNFDATCLLNSGVIHVTCTGFQKETLTFLKKSGPSLKEVIPDSYNRCLVAGLLSPRLIDVQPSSLSQEEQLEAILSAAIQTSSLGLLTGYIRTWIIEEQPNSAANLRFVLEWTWNKVVLTKEEFDRLCAPLFDGSCRFIDPQTIQSIQQCHLLLSNLNTVLSCFAMEAQGITERGLVDLSNKHMVTQLICQYAQMVLWFSHSGLLPEGLDDALQLSRLRYNYPVIENYYTSRRQKCGRSPRGKWNHDCLMIDGLVSQLGDQVEKLWKRDEGGTGKYPPASIHALLDIYLLDNITETSKHAITIYLLLDIMYSFPNKTDTPIESFPTAFAISWGQVKLVQGFWLLDHNDYENGLDLLFHPVTAKPASWQHSKIMEAFMSQGEYKQALRYLQTMKPTVSSSTDVILHLTVLLFNRCMVEAWNLLRQNSNRVNIEELLKHAYEVCQEIGLMEDLLKLPFTDTEQECLVKFLQSSTSVQNHEFLLVHHLQRANYISALKLNQTLKNNLTSDRDPRLRERSVTRNSILDQYGKILPRVQRKLAVERAKPYHLSTSSVFQVSRPKPLSAFPKKAVTGTVLTRSTFISNVLSKIGEVWASHEPKNGVSLYNSPKIEQPSPVVHPFPHPELPEAFVGTPISKTSQRLSRLLDLVVHPIPQPSQCLEFIQQSPTRSPLCLLSSSLPLSSQLKRPHQSTSRPAELLLLETPLVVKKAKSLALSATSSGFAEFTPPSILRSGLRTTPLASPSLSPGRSLTPPFRLKETKISFMEEGMNTHWTDRAEDDHNTKAFVSASFYKCAPSAEAEWTATSDKNTYFPLDVPAKSHQKVVAESLDTHSRSLEKLDVSKEDSTTSARSDQTSLEYHDAPSPEDFEDGVFVSPQPASASTELTANSALQTEKENDKHLFKSEGTPSVVEKQMGTVEVALEGFSEFSHLSPHQRIEASLCVSSVCEGKSPTSQPKASVLDEIVSTGSRASTLTADHNESVANTVEDGERSGPTTSQCPVTSEWSLDQKLTLTLKEDHELGAGALTESVGFPEDKPQISARPPEAQEVHLIEPERLEVQNSEEEAKNLSFNELYSSGAHRLQYNVDTIEQQFCDLPDDKDPAECDIAEVDGELFVTQSNFTLILEGEEGEVEASDSAAPSVLPRAANIAAKEKSVSGMESNNQEHVTDLPSAVTGNKEPHKVETLPYVPEPIKVAIAENLLGVIKDTRSKEATSADQVVHENKALVSPKVTHSSRLTKSTQKTVRKTSAETVNTSQGGDTVSTRTRTRRQHALNLNVTTEQESSAIATPKKKTRKIKELPGSSESTCSEIKETLENQQALQSPPPPRRGRKQKEEVSQASTDAVEQEPRKTPERLRLQPPEPATEQKSSVRKGAPRRLKKSVENGQSAEIVNDLKVSKAASHGGTVKKLRNNNLENSQNMEYKEDEKPSDQQLPLKRKRMRESEVSVLSITEEPKLDPSQLPLQTGFDVPATPRKRGRPRKVVPLEAVGSTATEEQTASQKKEVPSVRRSTRNTPAKNVSVLQKSILVPNEEAAVMMTSKKKLTKKSADESLKGPLPAESDCADATTYKEPADREGRLLAMAALTKSSRSTRTRSRKTMLLTDFSEPKTEPLFSPPSVKVPKKTKAEKMEATAQLKDLVSDLSSQFVVSPPALRTRQKSASSTSKILHELESDPKPLEIMEQKPKRSRPVKTKASRKTGKGSSWSPPPVEIKLISPLASPVDEIKISKPRKTTEAAGKTLGRGKKKLSSFPKQILRRKML